MRVKLLLHRQAAMAKASLNLRKEEMARCFTLIMSPPVRDVRHIVYPVRPYSRMDPCWVL